MLKGISRSGLVRPSAPSAPRSAAPRKMRRGGPGGYTERERMMIRLKPRTIPPPEVPCGGNCHIVRNSDGQPGGTWDCNVNCNCVHVTPPEGYHVENMCVTH